MAGTDRNSVTIDALNTCSEALERIEQARKALSRGANIGGAMSMARSAAYKTFDAAFEAVVEYQKSILNHRGS